MSKPGVTAVALFAAVAAMFFVGRATAAEFKLRNYSLHVPEGFEVHLAAEPPFVRYPICADFDERGRLYVCESSGAEDWNKPQPQETPHRVLRLEDVDGDGVFDRRTVFAKFEMMAQGAAWLDGSLYVAAAPVIWKLTDDDDDGVAERREAWIKTDAVTGCLNDLRGPYRGPDGFIYWCKGPATQTYTRDGKEWTSSARHILRRHPRGGDVDVLMVGGMDNPVEIAFAPGGERFVTCTNFQILGTPRDDGILHAVYGGVYPKDIGPVYEFPWSGPELMPKLTGWGAMSPAGLMCCRSTMLGPKYDGNLFSALFSGHKVMRHVLEPRGGTFVSRDEDFLTCENVEFHPTDVLEDADGSLLVIETGGWYRHCCPSSTFYRPDVDGAIYRIRRTGAAPPADPRGRKIDFVSRTPGKLADLLADARPAVRQQAVDRLAKLGRAALPLLRDTLANTDKPRNAEARLAAVWTATRIAGDEARGLVRTALGDPDDAVRHAALSSVSLWRDKEAVAALLAILGEGSPQDRRIAAEALGRIGDREAVSALLAALAELESPIDRFVEHSLVYALIELGDAEATRAGLASKNVRVRRGAMIALDQMRGGDGRQIEPQQVVAELDSSDAAMQDAAWWIVSRHAQDWSRLLADHLRVHFTDAKLQPARRAALKARLARIARTPAVSRWIIDELTTAGVSAETRMLLLEAMGDAGGQFAEPQWVESLLRMLQQPHEPDWTPRLIATLGKLPPLSTRDAQAREMKQSLRVGLIGAARDSELPNDARVQALAAIRDPSLGRIDDELFAFLVRNLAPEQPLNLRTSAAEAIARSQLTPAQRSRLAGSLKNLAATELTVLLGLFEGCTDEETGRRFVGSLSGSSAADGLNAFRLRTVLADFGVPVQQLAKPLFARLEQAQAAQLAKADRVLELVGQADPQRGIQVFMSQKASCTACHKAAHVGGVIGPHLRGIGKRRTERDLIESILFPSASLVQSYETWNVATTDGRVLGGVLLEDKPDEIVISTGVEKTYRLPRSAIEQMSRSAESIMPTGLDKVLSERDLADLIAYLKSLE